MDEYLVYIRVDDAGRMVDINSSAFLTDTDGWMELDHGYGDRYHHAQGNYLPRTLVDDRGIYRYKLDGDTIRERTAEEMDADVKPAEKSVLEKRLEKIETSLNTITELVAKLGMK